MRYEVAFEASAEEKARTHLLQHYRRSMMQEDLCFALWRPSTGQDRTTGLIGEVILPKVNERDLHHNVSFRPEYFKRVLDSARAHGAGLAFFHSHPADGWQDMSLTDAVAEHDVLAGPANGLGYPLIGMTIGRDGTWSARVWKRVDRDIHWQWCDKVRIVRRRAYQLHFSDRRVPPLARQEVLRRTVDTWGTRVQNALSRLHVGIIGLGSVGSIVAEAVARIGVGRATLIDPDHVESHNLDRLMNADKNDIGAMKVDISARAMKQHGTASNLHIISLAQPLQSPDAYSMALDCDIIFSCVDRPAARDVANFIAYSHLIPIIDTGILVDRHERNDELFSAHWRSHLITPSHQCLRCNGQYDTSSVHLDLGRLLDDPSYIAGTSADLTRRNENVFPFSLSAASMAVNQMVRYIIGNEAWPDVQQQDYEFKTNSLRIRNESCRDNCRFPMRTAMGDLANPPYISR